MVGVPPELPHALVMSPENARRNARQIETKRFNLVGIKVFSKGRPAAGEMIGARVLSVKSQTGYKSKSPRDGGPLRLPMIFR